MPMVAVIIAAAGEGRRFGQPKQFALLAGRPVVHWAIEAFALHPLVNEIIVVFPDETQAETIKLKWPKVKAVVKGGKERQDSVARGLAAVSPEGEIILIHDGVRPLVKADLITRIIEATLKEGAAVPAIPIEDTVKQIEGDRIVQTIDREKLLRVQTPQGFKRELLEAAFLQAQKDNFCGSDEASLVERIGGQIKIVIGDKFNLKITCPEDLKIAEVWLNESRYRL
ncbi:MAG: 2-C-methyl-D-erythritol 4-phosphate cytidylyltransferase [Candidatus Aminicenantes bacterium]|nr:2-C-methyl-D-erythritol 4-phosphate cytidylyltransferase [Candidatus Aminicenantes bacterium]